MNDDQVINDSLRMILGYLNNPKGGLHGKPAQIVAAIMVAKRNLHLTDGQVARLKVLFNV